MRVLLLLTSIILAGCLNSQSNYLWLDNRVVEKLQNTSSELTLSRPKLEFSNGGTVFNCEQYFHKEGDIAENSANYSARSHYLICDALRVAKAWPPKSSARKFDGDLSLCSKVNLTSFKHSLRPRVDTENATLTQLFGVEAVDGVNTCTFQGEGRNFVLNAVLRVKEEEEPQKLWVWVTDEILDATYRSYAPVWFTFDETKGMWVASK